MDIDIWVFDGETDRECQILNRTQFSKLEFKKLNLEDGQEIHLTSSNILNTLGKRKVLKMFLSVFPRTEEFLTVFYSGDW